MFIILLDEPTLFVFESEEAVRRDIEPPDAESEDRAIFDENAIPHRVEWIRPNTRRKWFFGLGSITFGDYRLVPCGEADPSRLTRLLEEHGEWVHPPALNESLGNILKRLRRE
jgi:hypothetical protein